jgi:Na+/proline symporter
VVASGVLVFAQIGFFLWIGTLLYAFYRAQPPAVAFTADDQVFPRFIAEQLPVGLGGLVIAAVFAAAMSTLSSSLSALASVSTIDLWGRWRGRDAEQSLRDSHRFTAIWAAGLAVIAFLAQAWGSVLVAGLTITSITFGAVLGIFVVGQTRWRVSANQAAAAMLAGVVALVAVHLVGGLAWTWYTLLGALVTIACAGLAALLGSAQKGSLSTS